MGATSEKRGKWRPWCDMNRVAYCFSFFWGEGFPEFANPFQDPRCYFLPVYFCLL